MAKGRKTRRKQRPRPVVPRESPGAETLTVAWMVTMMATLLGQVAALGIRLYVRLWGASLNEKVLANVNMMAWLMLFVAAVTGLLSLILAPLAYRSRQVPPPWTVTLFAVVIAVIPIVTILGCQ